MDRKEFFAFKTAAAAPQQTRQVKRRTTTGLTKYTGTWCKSEVKHLLSRALFGYSRTDMNNFLAKGLDTSISDLLNTSSTAPAPPLNNYGTGSTVDPNVPYGQTWVNAAPDPLFNGQRRLSFKAWWAG